VEEARHFQARACRADQEVVVPEGTPLEQEGLELLVKDFLGETETPLVAQVATLEEGAGVLALMGPPPRIMLAGTVEMVYSLQLPEPPLIGQEAVEVPLKAELRGLVDLVVVEMEL
jgi:hypothetical protein